MGKDADCCDTCREFGHSSETAPLIAAIPLPAPSPTSTVTIIVQTGGTEESFVATKREIVIGRISASDLPIRDGALSKRQCVLRITDSDVTVEDLRSTCGTYVDGRITRGPTQLGAGSVIAMGSTRIRIVRS
jgi:pSer/pThr/pTyr-binding forkhead associated (FHA) protein